MKVNDRGHRLLIPKSRSRQCASVRWISAAAAVAACLIASGCQSQAGSKETSTGAGDNAVQRQIKATVQTWLQRPTKIAITESPGPVPANKLVEYVGCGAPSCAQIGSYAEAAARALGWRYKFVNAGSGADPAQVKQAYDQAIRDNADAVFGSGFPLSIYESEAQELSSKGVPVIEWAVTDPPGQGITAVMDSTAAHEGYGTMMADYIMANNPLTSATSVLYVTINVYPTVTVIGKALQAELKAKCPDCKYAELAVPGTSIGQDLPSRVVAYLRAHPDVNNLAFGFNDMTLGVPAALKAAGEFDKIKTSVVKDTDATVNTYIRNGEIGAVTCDPWPLNVWRSFDYLIRHWNGKPTDVDTDLTTLPRWLITKNNIPHGESYPPIADYEAQFKRLWNIG